jgi:hypothetical protein
MLKKGAIDIRKLEGEIDAIASMMMDYRVEDNNPIPILYQSGYLTIKSYSTMFDEYRLGYPNEEVKYGFLEELLPAYAPQWRGHPDFSVSNFLRALMEGDVDKFMTIMTAFYASIHYDSITGKKDERYYQFIFYLLFSLMGQVVETEVKGSTGRADAVVKTADTVFVFEFKMEEKATAEQALAQIDEKGYSIPYSAGDKKIVKIGVEFSIEERGIKRWIIANG